MKVIIVNNNQIINFNNIIYIRKNGRKLDFIFGVSIYSTGYSGANELSSDELLCVHCSTIEELNKIYKKIIDFLKDKDETILELNINNK